MTTDNKFGQPEPVSPEWAACHTKAIGEFKDFADCLIEPPPHCRYSLRFGFGYMCFHPHWREFTVPPSERAKKNQEKLTQEQPAEM